MRPARLVLPVIDDARVLQFELVEVEFGLFSGQRDEVVSARDIRWVAGRVARRVEFATIPAAAQVSEIASARRSRRPGDHIFCIPSETVDKQTNEIRTRIKSISLNYTRMVKFIRLTRQAFVSSDYIRTE